MFRGNIVRPSHEGGLLISFTGSSPALGSTIETEKGVRLGKVDTVLGSIHNPWVHVHPISKGLDIVDVLGEDAKVVNKRSLENNRPRREERNKRFSRDSHRNENKSYNTDWICSKCSNDNFGWRERCNKCSAPKGGNISRNQSENGGNRFRTQGERGGNKNYNNDWICSKCSNDNFGWRERCNKCSAPKTGGSGSREQRGGNDRSRRPRGDNDRSRRPRGDNDRSRRPRGDNSDKSETRKTRDKSPKRFKGKSRSHFRNRELDDIFKRREE